METTTMEKTQHSEKLLLRKLDLLLRTGKLLMESAADTSRIMRNMKRTAAYLGYRTNICTFISTTTCSWST